MRKRNLSRGREEEAPGWVSSRGLLPIINAVEYRQLAAFQTTLI